MVIDNYRKFYLLLKMKKVFSLLIGALLVYSCSPKVELGTPFHAGQEVVLCASIDDDGAPAGAKRVSGVDSNPESSEGGLYLSWDVGDKILVTVGEETAVFVLSSGAGGSMGTFRGEMPAEGGTYDVTYPADYKEDMLSTQTYVANGFGKGLMKLTTKTSGTIDGGFTLSADNALLGLQLTGSTPIGKIVLTNLANKKSYTLSCPGVTLSDDPTLFYIVVPTGTWGSGFRVDVYGSDNISKYKSFFKYTDITFSAGSAVVMPPQEVAYQNIGVFSVAEGKKVTFSPGNLRYHSKSDTWGFAPLQQECYEAGGIENIDGWVDLFGWSTAATNYGVNTSDDSNDYLGEFIDWGANEIGMSAANTWRTLSEAEWIYLLSSRPNATSLQGVACVNGINGLILLSDDFVCPSGIVFVPGYEHASPSSSVAYAAHQSFTGLQWAQLEKAGALFLPASGYRIGVNCGHQNVHGTYWSSTERSNNVTLAQAVYFYSNRVTTGFSGRSRGNSVRLVKDL